MGKDEKDKPIFGDYKWKSFKEVAETAGAIGRGIMELGLFNEDEGDGRMWKFTGIWSKNRREWLETELANCHFTITTIGFFDSMGPPAIDFIVK